MKARIGKHALHEQGHAEEWTISDGNIVGLCSEKVKEGERAHMGACAW